MDAFDVLEYRLHDEAERYRYHFSDLPAPGNLREALYTCLWGEDIHQFIALPKFRPAPGDWHELDSQGKRWTLADAQAEVRKHVEVETGQVKERRKGMICGNPLSRGDRCYNCKTCGVDCTAVLCSDCFFASDHTGHDVSFGLAYSFSGYCDCGDPGAWINTPQCCNHPPPTSPSEPSSFNPDAAPPVTARISRKRGEEITRVLRIVLDYVIETLQQSVPDNATVLPKSVQQLLSPASPRPNSGLRKKTWEGHPFGLAVWADETHTLKEIMRQMIHATGCTPAEAQRLAATLEREGRVVVETSTEYYRLLHVAHTLAQIDMGITLRPANQVYREQVCGLLISWLADLCECSVDGDELVLRRAIASALLEPAAAPPEPKSLDRADDTLDDVAELCRMDWFFYLFSKLWRKARIDMLQVFVKVLTADVPCKLAIGNHFAKVYHRLVDQYIFTDREPELSLLLWGMQLFPVPIVAESAIATEHLLHTLISTLTAYFTQQHDDRRLTRPPRYVNRFDAEVQAFRTKKWQTISSHLKTVLNAKGVQRQIMVNPSYMETVLGYLELFTGMAPQIRATDEHVEYETDSWIRALGVTMDLSRMTAMLGQSYDMGDHNTLIPAMKVVTLHIYYNTLLLTTVMDPEKFRRPDHHTLELFGQQIKVIRFSVANHWVSIHNPLHWYLAELVKHVPRQLDQAALTSRGFSSLAELFHSWLFGADAVPDTSALLALLEYPLRTVAFLAQVRAGMWVRNGIGMSAQVTHYRECPLRETTYDQDMVILQFFLCCMNPTTVIATIVDRFGLTDFYQGKPWLQEVEIPQESQLVQEFLLLLINLLSETWAFLPRTREDYTRREVIHQLCLGPLSYSELTTRKLSERILDIPSFVSILSEVATLKVPQAVGQTGVYELKEDYFAEVNPLYHHYTRNQQGEAYEMLVKRQKAAAKDAPSQVVPPKRVELPAAGSQLFNLLDCLKVPTVIDICHRSLRNAMRLYDLATSPGRGAPQADGILDLSLHLLLLAFTECPSESSTFGVRDTGTQRDSLLQCLCELESQSHYKAYHPRIQYVIESIATYEADRVQSVRRVPRQEADPKHAAAEERKAAIRKRQQAIMAGFASDQKHFMENFDDLEDGADNDGMVEPEVSHGPCIVCQEDCTSARPSGLLSCVQPSKVKRDMCVSSEWMEDCLRAPLALDEDSRTRFLEETAEVVRTTPTLAAYPPENARFGAHVSACGHMMHQDCLAKFFRDTELRQSLQVQRNHPENAYRKEFVCPLCKSVGNILIPLDTAFEMKKTSSLVPELTLGEWVRTVMHDDLALGPDIITAWDGFLESKRKRGWSAEGSQGNTALSRARDPVDIGKRFQDVILPLSQQTRHLQRGDRSGLYLPEDVVGYTLAMLEIAQRGQPSSGDSAVYYNDANRRLLRGLLEISRKRLDLGAGTPQADALRRRCLIGRFLSGKIPNDRRSPSVLTLEPLTLLIEAAVIMPEVLHPITVLTFYLEFVRTVLGLAAWVKASLDNVTIAADLGGGPHAEVIEVFGPIRELLANMFGKNPDLLRHVSIALTGLTDDQVGRLIYTFTLPFLRRAAILSDTLHGGSAGTSGIGEAGKSGEYERLLKRLRIISPREAYAGSDVTVRSIVANWVRDNFPTAGGGRSGGPTLPSYQFIPSLEYPGIYELYRLPHSLEQLLQGISKRRCGKCNKEPAYPAICYFCGAFLCLVTDCCAEGEFGECNLHRMGCGGAVGIFIDVKRWAAVYLYGGSGSYGPMPYLDCHGELDQAMRRGHPQFQYKPRADEIRKIWLNHGIPSFVARKLELSLDAGGWGSL